MSPQAAAWLAVRVPVGDTWMLVPFDANSNDTVASLKARALASQKIAAADADRYEVKLGGARIADETRSLGSAGVRNGSALIVLAKHRRPVR